MRDTILKICTISRAIMSDPETNTDEMEEFVDIPERRSNYLFRSRRSENGQPEDKRSSSYLLRTRKSSYIVDPRTTRGQSYLFRTRKSVMDRSNRGSYLFRTRKMDQNLDRMLRSQGRSYLFRTRR